MSGLVTLYERLGQMAVSQARVVDPRVIPGDVVVEPGLRDLRHDPVGRELGFIDLYVSDSLSDSGFQDNLVLALTRFVVDATVDVNDLFDHAFVEARELPEWIEQRADRAPIGPRTQGASIQAGTYRDGEGRYLFSVTRYEAYQRGNVVYLLQCTGTTASEDASRWSAIAHAVGTARFED